jgi:predicted house-cleaning noncanonical NTP pyrophosphatase (MazG superfamily)
MPRFYLNKIVRDKILDEYINDTEVEVDYGVLSGYELIRKLAEKAMEETSEIVSVVSNQSSNLDLDELTSEIADTREILDTLCKTCGISEEAIAARRKHKRTKKGGFERSAYIVSLKLPENHSWTKYYRLHPDKFREE